MKNRVSAEFIERFRTQHNLDPAAYAKPALKSEQLFTVGYEIRPFRMCATSIRTHGGMICFS